jgi:hypothetical protein
VLYRVHKKVYPASSLNPTLAHRYYGGGRFDSTEDAKYAFGYAGESVEVAISETFLRDLSINAAGARLLPKSFVRGRRISAVRVRADLQVLQLTSGVELGQLSQDTWLTTCDPRDYAQTRHWGHTIRQWSPTACGFAWLSRREPGMRSYVLFEDRCPPNPLDIVQQDPHMPKGLAADFDAPHGVRWLRQKLSKYGVVVARR